MKPALFRWWQAQAPRERRLLLIGGTVLGLYLLWALAVQPAWRAIARAEQDMLQLDRQWQAMQLLAEEAGTLRQTSAVAPDQAAAALEAATARLGAQGRLSLQGDRAVLTLNGAGTTALRDWLAEARSGARARPVEASLSRAGTGLSGTIVLAIGGGS